ncbi:MAG: glycosyltransferase [Fibrobacter sp.]|nr:glycosyltransferase [Fibrobacter sp.]
MSSGSLLIVIPYPQKSGIFSVYMTGYLDQYKKLGYEITTEKLYFWEGKIRYSLKWLYLMRYLADRKKTILLHVHTIPASGPFIILFLLLSRVLNRKVIVVSHETVQTYAKHLPRFARWIAYFYESLVVHLSSFYVVHTSFHKKEIESFAPTPKLRVIPHPAVKVEVKERERTIWGFYGMLSAKKGVDLLIDTYQEFPPGSLPQLKIYGAAAPGEEAYYESCRQMVKSEFSSLIHFTGMISEADKAEEFSKLSLMILPYRYISQSGVLSEATMHRVPFLASDLTFFRDFKDKFGCGRLFKTEDKESLKEEFVKISKDPLCISDEEFAALQNELSIERCAGEFQKLISKQN